MSYIISKDTIFTCAVAYFFANQYQSFLLVWFCFLAMDPLSALHFDYEDLSAAGSDCLDPQAAGRTSEQIYW